MIIVRDNSPEVSKHPVSRSIYAGPDANSDLPSSNFENELLGIDPALLLRHVDDLCTRAEECKAEMGLMGPGDTSHVVGSWAWRRACFRAEYGNTFGHRGLVYPGSVFDTRANPGGNLSLPVGARFVRMLYAKFADDIIGTNPFLAVMPAKISDAVRRMLSKQVEKKIQDELSRSNVQFIIDESIRVALVENERVVKLAWVTEKTQRPELRAVAVYVGQGQAQPAPPKRSGEGEEDDDGGETPDVVPGLESETEPDADDAGGSSSPNAMVTQTAEGADSSVSSSPSSPSPERSGGAGSPNSPGPITTKKGDFILEKDDIITTLADASGKFLGLYVAPGATGPDGKPIAPTPIPPGAVVQMRLRKEPDFILATGMVGDGSSEIGDGAAAMPPLGEGANPPPNSDLPSPISAPPAPGLTWTGGMVDPATGALQFQTISGLIGHDVQKDQLEAYGLKLEDFIYDIKQPTLDHSDIQIHVYDDDLDDVLASYGVSSDPTRAYLAVAAASQDTTLAAKYAAIGAKLTESSPQSGASQGLTHAGERYGANGSKVRKTIAVWESYYRVRLQPDDKFKTWVFIVVDAVRRVPVYAEYLGNMRMKKPPFRILRGLESEPGRAYGVGVYQKFETRQLAIDFWFNRAKLKSAKAASADFMHADAFLHEQDAQKFVWGSKKIYRLKSAAGQGEQYGKDHPPVFRVNVDEMTEKEFEIIDKLVQTGMFEFGIVNIGEIATTDAGVAKDETATATRNIERTGNTLQRSTENLMALDVAAIMEMAIDITLENADLGAGEFTEDGNLLPGLNRDEIRDLPRDVRLLLTKARSAESMETNTQVKTTLLEYVNLPKWQQRIVRPTYIEILKTLDVADADDKLKDPTDKEIADEAQAAKNPPKEEETIQITADDMTPVEIGQALQQQGIQPDAARAGMAAVTPNQATAAAAAAKAAVSAAAPPKRPGEGENGPAIPGLEEHQATQPPTAKAA